MGEVELRWDRWAWPGVTGLIATTLATGVFGWLALFSAPVGADEGYVLNSLREWSLEGTSTTGSTRSRGPSTSGRSGCRPGCSASTGRLRSVADPARDLARDLVPAGLSAWRLTRRLLFGIAAQVVVFSLMAVLLSEPMHPGALLCLLLSGLVGEPRRAPPGTHACERRAHRRPARGPAAHQGERRWLRRRRCRHCRGGDLPGPGRGRVALGRRGGVRALGAGVARLQRGAVRSREVRRRLRRRRGVVSSSRRT